MSEHVVHVSDASFEDEVLKSQVPVLVDFWAEWCGPCKAIAPVVDEIARQYAGRLKVCKMDVDANGETPMRYNVRGIPTLMIFSGGNAEATKVGAVSKTQLAQFIDGNIA
ncbi:MAG: thioredoxin TrxA [Gammaproteobacteria bacterium]